MGLLPCPDCGKMISSNAEYCLNCGCPMNYIKSEHGVLFCAVEFIENTYSKEYFYISDDNEIKAGDFALVDVSGANEEKIVKVNRVLLCMGDTDAPYPVKATKHLKRKLYGKEIEIVMLKYMEVYVGLFTNKQYKDASAYLDKFVPIIKDYANQGLSFGQFAYGVILDKVYDNQHDAKIWYEKAAKQGCQASAEALKKLSSNKSCDKMINDYESAVDEFSYRDWLDYTGGEPLNYYSDHEDD